MANDNGVVTVGTALQSSIDELDEMSNVKTLEFPDNGLITGNQDVNDPTQLNIVFLGLPTRKTNTGTIRRATELKFPQANVFGGVGVPVMTIINGKNWWNIVGSAIEGAPYLTGTPAANTTFNIMYSPGSFLCTPIVEAGYTFTAFSVGKMGYITHSGGNVFCSNIGAWYPFNSKIINSTSVSPYDVVSVSYSGFSADGVTYGTIVTTGATVIKNYNIEGPYNDICLSAVSTVASTLITTTASTLIAGTKKLERGISYNATNGELTFAKTGTYNIAVSLKVDCTKWNKKLELWIEKFNGSAWEVVADTGFVQNFQTDQENIPHYDFAGYFTVGEKYRLRAVSDSDTTVSLKTITLANGVKMPAIRVSVQGN